MEKTEGDRLTLLHVLAEGESVIGSKGEFLCGL